MEKQTFKGRLHEMLKIASPVAYIFNVNISRSVVGAALNFARALIILTWSYMTIRSA